VKPTVVQIAGADPKMMAEAARYNVVQGAEIIDINMGCPAKKVCNVMAGSALLQNEPLVADILDSVVKAADVPVTLKIRTGWDKQHKNAVRVAKIAEASGVRLLAIHGRTRACLFGGEAEYDTIAEVKSRVGIPVVANGDLGTPEKVKSVLDYTKADGAMLGRAAQGRPWLFREVAHYLNTGSRLPPPEVREIRQVLLQHLEELYRFYGEYLGVRVARKHISWYTKGLYGSASFRRAIVELESAEAQVAAINDYFDELQARGERLAYEEEERAA
jgi:tRNA-dihydrouridine synthase B